MKAWFALSLRLVLQPDTTPDNYCSRRSSKSRRKKLFRLKDIENSEAVYCFQALSRACLTLQSQSVFYMARKGLRQSFDG